MFFTIQVTFLLHTHQLLSVFILSLTDDVLFCLPLWGNPCSVKAVWLLTVALCCASKNKNLNVLPYSFDYIDTDKGTTRQKLIFDLVCTPVSCGECPPSPPSSGLFGANPDNWPKRDQHKDIHKPYQPLWSKTRLINMSCVKVNCI